MDHQLALEDFLRYPGCFERLASHWLPNHNGNIPYVICYNPFCEDFNLGFPMGYGLRLMKGDRRVPAEPEVDSAFSFDPLLMDLDTSELPDDTTESEGQDIESMLFSGPGMLPQDPPFHQLSVLSNLEAEPKVRQTRQKPALSPRDPCTGEMSTGLEHPLSELTDFSPEPILTIEAYVNRSVQDRAEEALAKGKVPRPVNAFMLYRKAYQAYAKGYLAEGQVVSQVVAASWRLETEEVCGRFFEFARIDSANYQLAHPGYKYTPKLKA